jgi:hypothetical protein
MQAWGRDKDAHEQQHPPDEGDGEEGNGDEAQCADGPEVVGSDLVSWLDVLAAGFISREVCGWCTYGRVIGIQECFLARRLMCAQQTVPLVGLSA